MFTKVHLDVGFSTKSKPRSNDAVAQSDVAGVGYRVIGKVHESSLTEATRLTLHVRSFHQIEAPLSEESKHRDPLNENCLITIVGPGGIRQNAPVRLVGIEFVDESLPNDERPIQFNDE